jgi:hypothetical protein
MLSAAFFIVLVNVIILRVVMLNVIKLSVVMLSVVVVSFAAPNFQPWAKVIQLAVDQFTILASRLSE